MQLLWPICLFSFQFALWSEQSSYLHISLLIRIHLCIIVLTATTSSVECVCCMWLDSFCPSVHGGNVSHGAVSATTTTEPSSS